MRKTFFISCLLSLALAAAPALAFGPGGHGHGGPGGDLTAYKLLFSEEQNKQLDALLKTSRSESMPLVKKLMEDRKAMKALMKSDASTEKDIRDQVAKTSQIFADLAVKRAALTKAVRKIATKEQLDKIDAFTAKQSAKREKFREAMGKMVEQGAFDD
jgi:Spy/CpxP family protein refolding chaperone